MPPIARCGTRVFRGDFHIRSHTQLQGGVVDVLLGSYQVTHSGPTNIPLPPGLWTDVHLVQEELLEVPMSAHQQGRAVPRAA